MTPVTDCRTLKSGDVLVVDVTITDRITGQDRVWRSFRLVKGTPRTRRYVDVVLCKLHPEKKDHRTLGTDEGGTSIWLLPEDQWPQGVIAVRTKYILTGLIELED